MKNKRSIPDLYPFIRFHSIPKLHEDAISEDAACQSTRTTQWSRLSRGLQEEDISLEARLAIADVFEALTASDRPYNTAKSLSQSIKTLSFMSKDRHIDNVDISEYL